MRHLLCVTLIFDYGEAFGVLDAPPASTAETPFYGYLISTDDRGVALNPRASSIPTSRSGHPRDCRGWPIGTGGGPLRHTPDPGRVRSVMAMAAGESRMAHRPRNQRLPDTAGGH
jgi:hypothetical protein